MPEHISEFIGNIIFSAYLFVIITSIITVLTDGSRNPVRTISWILVISLLPYIGILEIQDQGNGHKNASGDIPSKHNQASYHGVIVADHLLVCYRCIDGCSIRETSLIAVEKRSRCIQQQCGNDMGSGHHHPLFRDSRKRTCPQYGNGKAD